MVRFFEELCLSLGFLVLLNGCDPSGFMAGHYEGTLLTRANGQVAQTPVGIDVSPAQNGRVRVTVSDVKHQELLAGEISQIQSQGFTLSLPSVKAGLVQLTLNRGCYENASDETIKVCQSGNQRIVLQVIDARGLVTLELTGDRFSQPENSAFSFETPTDMTLSQAEDMALKGNFDSRIEFEHSMEAQNYSKASHLNLLPHLNINAVLNVLTPGTPSLIATLGDLAPFLLPSRILEAKAAGEAAQAESDALIVMQADTATLVEGLAYVLQRDEDTLAGYAKVIDRAGVALQKTLDIEKKNEFPEGSADHIRSQINLMEEDVEDLKEAVKEDRGAVAQALGMRNPEGVKSLTLDSEAIAVETAKPLVGEDLAKVAVSRSLEVRQMSHLITAAGKLKKARLFNWMDPEGDPTINLGPSLGAQLAVGKNQEKELSLKRDDLQVIVAQKVVNAVDQYNEALSSEVLVQKGLALQDIRYNRVLAQIYPQSNLNTLDVQAILQDNLATEVKAAAVRAQFRVARSKIDRALLQGYYLRLFDATLGN